LLVDFFISPAQDIPLRLTEAIKKLEAEPLMKHAIIAMSVADSKTGKQVFSKNAQTGLAPASCQKVFTSIAAFALLGPGYRYKTMLGYDGQIEGGILKGNLHIRGSGDPTLGSGRWQSTKENQVLQKWTGEIKKAGILKVNGIILKDESKWSSSTIPDGWIWQDIGNYYGAGASSLNWRENQYEVVLKSGAKIGDTCSIVSFDTALNIVKLISEVQTAARGTGDNAYIYLPPGANPGYIRGSIPAGENSFVISGSMHDPFSALVNNFTASLNTSGVDIPKRKGWVSFPPVLKINPLSTYLSPSLDSINYWFLKKSINLYGEALMKTMALEKKGFGSTEKGIELIKFFWSQQGIEQAALNIMDGCGLSPQNRVTTDALVKAMLYAKLKPWYNSFYHALPEINGITMKSGSINGARSYTGYIKSKEGTEYTFAIIINNYDGTASEVVRKMWHILDILK